MYHAVLRPARRPRGPARAGGRRRGHLARSSPTEQAAFDRKFSLGFPLLSDPDHAVADAWGAWGEKSMYGNRYEGIIRSSFLVDADGTIQEAFYKVAPKATVPKAERALRAEHSDRGDLRPRTALSFPGGHGILARFPSAAPRASALPYRPRIGRWTSSHERTTTTTKGGMSVAVSPAAHM